MTSAVDCRHGIGVITVDFSSDGRVDWFTAAVNRHRVPSGGESDAEGASPWEADPITYAERALLARKAKAVGRKALLELDTIVSPDILMRWHRRLVAEKWDFSKRRGPGRLGIMREISQLIVCMAMDNPGWGDTTIQVLWRITGA